MTPPTFLSLFSGIGGLDLGLERAGWFCVGQVEIDPYCQRVLATHWPKVPRWGDIKELQANELPRADLICAGFPCQPVSVAGRGLAQADERWLWPHVARLVRHLRPRWVLLENVPGLLARGMGDVLGDLAACGYDAEWDCVSAADVGAPHLRKRVWIVAYPRGEQYQGHRPTDERPPTTQLPDADSECVELWDQPGRRDGQGRPSQTVAGDDGTAWALADADSQRRDERAGARRLGRGLAEPANGDPVQDSDSRTVLASRLRWRTPQAGRAEWWAVEPDVGRVAHGVPARLDRLRSLGNAVVPQVAEHVGRLILQAHLEAAA